MGFPVWTKGNRKGSSGTYSEKGIKGGQELWDAIVMYVLVNVKRNRSSEWFQNLLKDITNGKLKIPKEYLQLLQIVNLPH